MAAQQMIETGRRLGLVSSAGAGGISQFIPSTAREYGVKFGTNKRAVKSQIMGQAHYLHDLGANRNVRLALGRYYGDPSSDYASRVLAEVGRFKGLDRLAPGGPLDFGGGGGGKMGKGPITNQGAITQANQANARSGLFGQIAALNAFADPDSPAAQGWNALAAANPSVDVPQTQRGKPVGGKKGGGGVLNFQGGGTMGSVKISSGADRAGVPTSKSVLNFVRRISGIIGDPLTIGTGSNHSQMTVSGNVSDHWSGHAADIPASGKYLIRLGQAALIAAGMKPKKARRLRGGLYNVNGHQIIFNTHEGGDHTNHLHVSA